MYLKEIQIVSKNVQSIDIHRSGRNGKDSGVQRNCIHNDQTRTMACLLMNLYLVLNRTLDHLEYLAPEYGDYVTTAIFRLMVVS